MRISLLMLIPIICSGCGPGSGKNMDSSGFSVNETDQGFELFENGQPVFQYQAKPKSRDGNFYFNNYLHPLYNLSGDTLTEEFPDDHYHHRGIFWAWHQLFLNDLNLGDQWMMDGIKQEITSVETELDEGSAVVSIMATWHSTILQNNPPREKNASPGKDESAGNNASRINKTARNKNGAFLEEQTTIIVHPGDGNIRIIDFEISLRALLPGIKMGGSDDKKGYGGFSARFLMPDNLSFTSEDGVVTPQTLQLKAGPWMDFSGSMAGSPEPNGVTILCHPETPNYPGTWILRQKNSMQNIVFPGEGLVSVPTEAPTVLKYRMIIHKGSSPSTNGIKNH